MSVCDWVRWKKRDREKRERWVWEKASWEVSRGIDEGNRERLKGEIFKEIQFCPSTEKFCYDKDNNSSAFFLNFKIDNG